VLVQGGLSNAGDHSTYSIISPLYFSKQKTFKQGNRILLGENFQEIVSFPTGSFPFGFDHDQALQL